MQKNTILNDEVEFIKHPKEEGVFMKHFFSSNDNDRLNNLEVKIEPGYQISSHIHDNSSEFYYVVSGEGEFLNNGNWEPFKKGAALKAPLGMEHGLKNTGNETLIVFSTFSPAIK
ncbi:MAG: cupin domain-containing protein [Solirubrobacterales bacterium]